MLRGSLLLFVLALQAPLAWGTSYFENIGWVKAGDSNAIGLQYYQLVEDIYRNNGKQLIWFDLQQSSQLEFQLELIDVADVSPLFSKQLSKLRFYRKSNRWYEYDLLATDSMIAYMSYAELAKQHGKQWFFDNRIMQSLPVPTVQAMASLSASIQSQQLGALIDSYTPDSDSYHSLIKTYLRIASERDEILSLYTQDTQLKRVGDIIENRESLLLRLQKVDVEVNGINPDVGYFDTKLEFAIKQFQRMHGLKPDGIIGPKTKRWLNKSSDDRLKMIAINAERTRIWPEQRNTLIVINVPSYQITYWYGGEAVFESQVIVGKISRQTPVMTTKLDSIIVNPTWNVPWKIMVEDIIPQVQQDPEYLDRKNIKIIPNWTSTEFVNPSLVDWQGTNPKAFPYRMRQMSGESNALGLYKFNTPNRRAIFLHDTPSKHLFDKESRAFSSGCVRVQHADRFAILLLENQGLNVERMEQAGNQSNKAIPLRTRIPVHIIYQTAWAEGGVVQYREDVYHLDR
ncbi:L,D-transpeptidase family protein [Vibrio kasasachensis]|uniref:L,D-transpeptidase family protein n=1 Tax=Vibrio kasasachensis TaxID=2910248 RepID=UPI003D10E631